eukprot:jgi/Orpsp1_1/1183048/evm.model.c7180000083659.1
MKLLSQLFITIFLVTLTWGRVIKKCVPSEFKKIKYGEKVNVNGKNMIFSIVGENNDIPIVFLPGAGVISPVLSYKPLAEALSDKFKVITVEPFGYGLSDVVDAERSTENIINELHTAFHNYGLTKFYLMGHSFGGLYSLGYANKYPEDVLGVIGIDNTPVGLEEVKVDEKENEAKATDFHNKFKEGYWKKVGFEEFTQLSSPIDLTYPYTEEELKNFKIIFGYTFFNDNYFDEALRFNKNIEALEGLKFPESIPVFQFVSSANSDYCDGWEPSHKALVSESPENVVLNLKGSHFLNIDQKDEIAKDIKEWILKIE